LRGVVAAIVIVASATAAYAAVEDDLRDGDKYFEDGDWHHAANAYDRAIGKAPGQVSAVAYGKRAAIYIILKDYKGGLEFIQRAKTHYPAAPEIMEQEALILWQMSKRDEAIAVAEKVVAAKPTSFTNQNLIGEYYAARDARRTVTAYEAYLANRPKELEGGDVLPRIRLGFAYLSTARLALAESDEKRAQEQYTHAVEQFEVVARKYGKKPNAQTNADNGLCAAYTGLGRFDQATTVCERVVSNPKNVDATGSVWFNLGTAYLARHQTAKARSAAQEFIKLRKTEPRGYILVGDTYFSERDWANALDQYLRAEKLVKATHDQVELSIRLGKTYRRIPAPAGATGNPNLALAIEKLASAFQSNGDSVELALELGGAYLEARQDGKAAALTDKLLIAETKLPPDARAAVLVMGGKALFNEHKLKEARQRFESAREIRGNDITVQRGLVLTINEEAFDAKDGKTAQGLLEQALVVDPQAPVTLTNLAVLSIDRGDCDAARTQLTKLENVRGTDEVARTRLLARAYLCGSRPDPKKAADMFAVAEREAKKENAQLELAEIYTEWAPLIWDTNLDDACEKLEIAVSTGGSDAAVGPPAKRNLSIALFRRGWRQMRDGKATEASADFERALRDPSVLKGNEPLAFDFSYAIALLDAGRAQEAGTRFKALAAKGNQTAYLKPPYSKVGSQFFAAYASYRNGTLAARQQAAADFAKLEGESGFGDKIHDLTASANEFIAVEQWRNGQFGPAAKSLAAAAKAAQNAELKRRIQMDQAALSLTKSDLPTLESLGSNPPEALVNLGILYDQAGRPKDAYDAWVKAKAHGVTTRDLQRWIDAKKRIYGF
jgi:lipopolysaccharide biosynthesis regulator YciM